MADWKSEVDWSEYHSGIEEILNEEFYWSISDNLTPNGCDAGADAQDFLIEWFEETGSAVLTEAGCEDILNNFDHSRDDIADIIADPDENDLMQGDLCRIMVGLAFAHFKQKGNCPQFLSSQASALLTVLDGFYLSGPDWQYADEWRDRSQKMAARLSAMPPPS